MSETWTFSEWSVTGGDPKEFIDAFRGFADAATSLGGAYEGMVLQDVENPAHFVVVRRWGGPGDVARWADEQGGHAEQLMRLAPEGGRAAVMTKVADLLVPPTGSADSDP
jgi:heme-degrading monooxygenase HmoA